MLCLYQPFVKGWLGDGAMLGMPVVLGLCAYFYILKSGDIRYVYHEGRGLWFESRFIMVGEAIVNIVLNIALCRTLGVFGIVLATVVSVAITNAYFCPRLLFRLYFRNGKLGEYWRDHAQYALTMVLTAGASWCACEVALPLGMVGEGFLLGMSCLVGRLAICTGFSMLLFWIIWHRSKRFKDSAGWMRRVAKA